MNIIDIFSKGETNMTILDKAIVFATEAHSGVFRKGGKTPYIVHPMEVAAIAADRKSVV